MGIYHGVHHYTTNCGVFRNMNKRPCNVSMLLGEDYGEYDPNEEPEVEYDLIGDMPEEEEEEGNIETEHQGWMRSQ